MRKNSSGQFWEVYAFDKDTRDPVSNIKETITAKIRIDDSPQQDLDDTEPDDQNTGPGFYMFDMLQEETDGDQLWIYPATTHPNTIVIGVPGYVATSLAEHVQGSGAVSFQSLYSMFGQDNIRRWADLDNDEDDVKIDARITDAISDVTDEVYDELRGHFDLTNIDGITGIRRVITRLIGVDLYTRRGIEDNNDAISSHRDVANKQLQRIITDLARTGQTRVGSRVPGVIID